MPQGILYNQSMAVSCQWLFERSQSRHKCNVELW